MIYTAKVLTHWYRHTGAEATAFGLRLEPIVPTPDLLVSRTSFDQIDQATTKLTPSSAMPSCYTVRLASTAILAAGPHHRACTLVNVSKSALQNFMYGGTARHMFVCKSST